MADITLFRSQYVNFGQNVKTMIKQYKNDYSSILNTNPVIVFPAEVFYLDKPELSYEEVDEIIENCCFSSFFNFLNSCGFVVKLIALDFTTDILENHMIFPNVGYEFENLEKILNDLKNGDYRQFFSMYIFIETVSIENKKPIIFHIPGFEFKSKDILGFIYSYIRPKFPFEINKSFYETKEEYFEHLKFYCSYRNEIPYKVFNESNPFHFTLPNSNTDKEICNQQYAQVQQFFDDLCSQIRFKDYPDDKNDVTFAEIGRYYAGHDMKDQLMYRFLTDERGYDLFTEFFGLRQ